METGRRAHCHAIAVALCLSSETPGRTVTTAAKLELAGDGTKKQTASSLNPHSTLLWRVRKRFAPKVTGKEPAVS